MGILPYMASVRTRDKDSVCYSTQNMWACYDFTIPQPKSFPAHHTRKMLQPQIADKATALQNIIDYQTGDWDLERAISSMRFFGGWKPFHYARSGTFKPKVEVNPFRLYGGETFGFSALVAKIVSGEPSWWIFGYPYDKGLSGAKHQIRKDYDEVLGFVYEKSRLVNFATYAGAKMYCEAANGAVTCEIDNTRTIKQDSRDTIPGHGKVRGLIGEIVKSGPYYYSKGAKSGYKLIVSTWLDERGNLSVRWAKSYPIFTNPAAFDLIASG